MEVSTHSIYDLQERIVRCERCPRLIAHCRKIAAEKRRAYRDWEYWGRPVPGWGDPNAQVVVVGLAPGAHGANRTGRMFTGDKSGEFLYRALWETGFASQPTSIHREDGLTLHNLWITASARCAPPDNKPLPEELRNCFPYLEEELGLLPQARVFVALGKIAADTCLRYLQGIEQVKSLAAHPFGHGALYEFPQAPALLCSYHPSQQNTSTGRLTAEMLRQIFAVAAERSGHTWSHRIASI
jgi:uracil-DNA glycosylase family 4